MKKLLFLFALACFIMPARIFAQYSDASVTGPWIVLSQNDLYILFSGSGTVIQLGISEDTATPTGTYNITSQGVISASLDLLQGPTTVTGTMLSDSSASIYVDTTQGPYPMFKVSNIGALEGNWSGYIYDSSEQAARNIQLTVNSSGIITAATGVPLIRGDLFEGAFIGMNIFAGYLTTSDADCPYQYINLYGIYSSGDTLAGPVQLGQNNVCGDNGSVLLTKTTTGVATINPTIDFMVYPQPFTDQLEITVKSPAATMQLDVYDLCGKKVYSQPCGNTQNINLNLSALSSGMYFLTLTADGQSVTKRLIKD